MAAQSGILELYINLIKVDEVKVWTQSDVDKSIKELKKVYMLDDDFDYEFWLVYKSSMSRE